MARRHEKQAPLRKATVDNALHKGDNLGHIFRHTGNNVGRLHLAKTGSGSDEVLAGEKSGSPSELRRLCTHLQSSQVLVELVLPVSAHSVDNAVIVDFCFQVVYKKKGVEGKGGTLRHDSGVGRRHGVHTCAIAFVEKRSQGILDRHQQLLHGFTGRMIRMAKSLHRPIKFRLRVTSGGELPGTKKQGGRRVCHKPWPFDAWFF